MILYVNSKKTAQVYYNAMHSRCRMISSFLLVDFPYLQLSGIINSYDEQDASISYQAYQTSLSFTFSLEETPVA